MGPAVPCDTEILNPLVARAWRPHTGPSAFLTVTGVFMTGT